MNRSALLPVAQKLSGKGGRLGSADCRLLTINESALKNVILLSKLAV